MYIYTLKNLHFLEKESFLQITKSIQWNDINMALCLIILWVIVVEMTKVFK